ncbi:hypothetical protein niasHT_024759 [Heterodera trifolii]|uniref:Uncharacterized protein n=1 Tax=Heterodera trifolii TaxID=157864 RepID=A0ABD2KNL4_9BILA
MPFPRANGNRNPSRTFKKFQTTLLSNCVQQQNAEVIFSVSYLSGDFVRNYVRGHDGRPPLFPVHSWNHHDSVLQDLGRTNNAQEGFHLALRMQFNSVHPPLSKVITVLKKEERIAADKLRQYELDPTQGIRIRERKKTYRENDLAIRNLVEGFGAIENPNEDEILGHFRSLQYRLMRNDFENWDDPIGD